MACRTITCMTAIEKTISVSNDMIKPSLSCYFLLGKQEMSIVEMNAGHKSFYRRGAVSTTWSGMDDMLNPAVPALQSLSAQRSAASHCTVVIPGGKKRPECTKGQKPKK